MTTNKDAAVLMNKLTWVEVSPKYPADMRRVIRAERETLQIALASGDAKRIAAARDEALRVAKMWGVEV